MSQPPPIGLRPRLIHLRMVNINRLDEIAQAMHRYRLANKPIPLEWTAEWKELLAERRKLFWTSESEENKTT